MKTLILSSLLTISSIVSFADQTVRAAHRSSDRFAAASSADNPRPGAST